MTPFPELLSHTFKNTEQKKNTPIAIDFRFTGVKPLDTSSAFWSKTAAPKTGR